MLITTYSPVPLPTEDAPVENIETFDSRQYLPEEFVDRSWLIIPEDNSNLQVTSNDFKIKLPAQHHSCI
jgi:hypothetical protein